MRSTYRKKKDIFLYELTFDDSSKYVGQSNNPSRRLQYHQSKFNEHITMSVIKKLADPWLEEDAHINMLRSQGLVVRNRTNAEIGMVTWESGRIPTTHSWGTPEGLVAGGKTGFKHQLAAGKNPCTVDVTCPHCGKCGKQMIMKRWHFDRCRSLVSAPPVES